MKPTDAQGLFEGLLTAESTKQVGELLQSYYVRGLDWKPYGGYYKNYNIAGAQQKTPEGALAEKVVNSIDAQIMSGLLRLGIDPTSKEDAPSSPAEAAKLCFCLLYTSDAADDLLCVDLGGRRIIKKKNK